MYCFLIFNFFNELFCFLIGKRLQEKHAAHHFLLLGNLVQHLTETQLQHRTLKLNYQARKREKLCVLQ